MNKKEVIQCMICKTPTDCLAFWLNRILTEVNSYRRSFQRMADISVRLVRRSFERRTEISTIKPFNIHGLADGISGLGICKQALPKKRDRSELSHDETLKFQSHITGYIPVSRPDPAIDRPLDLALAKTAVGHGELTSGIISLRKVTRILAGISYGTLTTSRQDTMGLFTRLTVLDAPPCTIVLSLLCTHGANRYQALTATGAFSKLALANDTDHLLDRLLFRLPGLDDPGAEPGSDRYSSHLWDVDPARQSILENDNIPTADGFPSEGLAPGQSMIKPSAIGRVLERLSAIGAELLGLTRIFRSLSATLQYR